MNLTCELLRMEYFPIWFNLIEFDLLRLNLMIFSIEFDKYHHSIKNENDFIF